MNQEIKGLACLTKRLAIDMKNFSWEASYHFLVAPLRFNARIRLDKHVACLESFWTHDIENRLSVAPVLKLLSKRNGTRSILLTCNSVDELNLDLGIVKHMKGYSILYLAFNGYPGGFYLLDLAIDMESLATFMGNDFRNWVIFFGSCQTLNVRKDRILNFMSKPGVKTVVGFKRKVEWLDGSAIDLLILNSLQFSRDMRKFWKGFRRVYKDLVRISGLNVYYKQNN